MLEGVKYVTRGKCGATEEGINLACGARFV